MGYLVKKSDVFGKYLSKVWKEHHGFIWMLKVKTQEEKNQLKKEPFNKNELELTDLENSQSISTLEKKMRKDV